MSLAFLLFSSFLYIWMSRGTESAAAMEAPGKFSNSYAMHIAAANASAQAAAPELHVYYSQLSYTSCDEEMYSLRYYAEAGGKKDFICGGSFCVAYESGEHLKISVFDTDMKFMRSLEISRELEYFGAAAGDESGSIYILWGADVDGEDSSAKKQVNLKLVKYDGLTGEKLGVAEYVSGEGYFNGTKRPFAHGNAALAICGDTIAAHFGREMFRRGDDANHQSSTTVYADKNTMRPVTMPTVYVSHSFDQQIIATSDCGFLMADLGDALPRAFVLSYVKAAEKPLQSYNDNSDTNSFETFHFTATKEGTGAAPGYAYNYTHAHMGGIAETDSAYVFAASSVREAEKSLPVDAGPRDVFVQILRKDFRERRDNADNYLVDGESRIRSGNDWYSNPFVDYGVIWLTKLSEGQNAVSPKVCALTNDRVAVFWEVFEKKTSEWGYETYKYMKTYYAILRAGTGAVLTEATELPGVRLPKDDRPVLFNGKVTWSLTEKSNISTDKHTSPGSLKIYCLDVDSGFERQRANPYNDVSGADWFYESVMFATENAIMPGASEETFDPGGALTRAMTAIALYRMSGSPGQAFSPVFSDVAETELYAPAIMWAYSSGVITGYGNGRFGPDDRITREQLAVMLYRYETMSNGGAPARVKYVNNFFDAGEMNAWAEDAVTWAVSAGLITGVGVYELAPRGNATRAQFAAILTRYMSRI